MVLNIVAEDTTANQPYDLEIQIFKALTHPARLAILEILHDGEHCVCHMEAYLGFRQAYISQQLAVLREADIIQDRREGWNIYYRIKDARIFEVLDAVRRITGLTTPQLRQAAVRCNCPHCAAEFSR